MRSISHLLNFTLVDYLRVTHPHILKDIQQILIYLRKRQDLMKNICSNTFFISYLLSKIGYQFNFIYKTNLKICLKNVGRIYMYMCVTL